MIAYSLVAPRYDLDPRLCTKHDSPVQHQRCFSSCTNRHTAIFLPHG